MPVATVINEVCPSCKACFNLYLHLGAVHPSHFLCLLNNWWKPTVIIMLLPQSHYSCTKSYGVFTKPQANVTFFTLHPGNNFGPKKSLLSSRDLFSSRGKMNETFSLKMPSFSWDLLFFFTRGIILVVLLCSVFCLGSWWDYPKLFPTSHLSECNTSLAVQQHIWEAKHQAWRGKRDVYGRMYQGELMVRLGVILPLFQEVWSDCDLKMKFLMPVSLPVCLLDQVLLWDWSFWGCCPCSCAKTD